MSFLSQVSGAEHLGPPCRMKDTYDSAKDKVTGTYDSTKDKMREAAESAQPHNDMEAIKSSGGIPSNTADLVSSGIQFTCP